MQFMTISSTGSICVDKVSIRALLFTRNFDDFHDKCIYNHCFAAREYLDVTLPNAYSCE